MLIFESPKASGDHLRLFALSDTTENPLIIINSLSIL